MINCSAGRFHGNETKTKNGGDRWDEGALLGPVLMCGADWRAGSGDPLEKVCCETAAFEEVKEDVGLIEIRNGSLCESRRGVRY